MSERRFQIRVEPDLHHPAVRLVVFVGGCLHRVSLAAGQPEMNFIEFAKHEHYVFCLNGPFQVPSEQERLRLLLGLRASLEGKLA